MLVLVVLTSLAAALVGAQSSSSSSSRSSGSSASQTASSGAVASSASSVASSIASDVSVASAASSTTTLPPGVSLSGSVIYISGYTLPYNSGIGSNFGVSTTLGAYQGSGTLTQAGFAAPTAAPREGWAAVGAAGAAAVAAAGWW